MTSFVNNPTYHEYNKEVRTFNKWLQPQFGKRLPIHIFGSGSEGNSIFLHPYRTLIDLGMTFKTYQAYDPNFFLSVDHVILTHHHGDHLNPATLKKIIKTYPHLKIYISDHMWDTIRSDYYKATWVKRDPDEPVPFGDDPIYKTDANGDKIPAPSKLKPVLDKHASMFHSVAPRELKTHDGHTVWFNSRITKHGDIPNIAIELSDPSLNFEFLYASDLDNLDGSGSFIDKNNHTHMVDGLDQEKIYNCMFLEANYDEDILNQWYQNLNPDDPDYRNKKARADGNKRHISEQQAEKYIREHLIDNGIFIPLHASSTFGTLRQ